MLSPFLNTKRVILLALIISSGVGMGICIAGDPDSTGPVLRGLATGTVAWFVLWPIRRLLRGTAQAPPRNPSPRQYPRGRGG